MCLSVIIRKNCRVSLGKGNKGPLRPVKELKGTKASKGME